MTDRTGLPDPTIEWNDGEFRVSFPLQGEIFDARWRPGIATVVRIWDAGTET